MTATSLDLHFFLLFLIIIYNISELGDQILCMMKKKSRLNATSIMLRVSIICSYN